MVRMARAVAILGRLTTVGILLGLAVGGVLGRLAMMLLADLNPDATGVQSDDDFEMGRFTLSGSLNLLLVAGVLGAVFAGAYVALRGLRVGPRWFQVLSLGGGFGIVSAAFLVHRDGVDFTLLQPLWLTVGLFIALPALYGGGMALVGERAVDVADPTVGWWWRPALLAWLPLAPGLLILAAGWAVHRRLHPSRALYRGAWAARGTLGVVFALAALDLAQDVAVLS